MNFEAESIHRSPVACCPAVVAFAVASIAIGAGGCGGSDAEAPQPKPQAITEDQAGLVKARMPRDRVIRKLNAEPVLTQGPIENFPRGCIYYPMQRQPLSNVWQFCFNNKGINLVLTQLSSNQPAPPTGASPQREALLARADAICQSQYGHLTAITAQVGAALKRYERRPTAPHRESVGQQIHLFIDNLEATWEQLAAFDPPDDQVDRYNAYLDLLRSQIDVLSRARAAFLDGDEETYSQLGEEFTEIGKMAKQEANDYGLSYCSASSFD